MFERYPEESRRVLYQAKVRAVRANAPFIDWDDLLVGALAEASYLRLTANIVPERSALDHRVPTQPDHIEFSPVVHRLLQSAMLEANRLGHHRIRPDHLLLALFDESDCPAGDLLRGAGVERPQLVDGANRAAKINDGAIEHLARAILVRKSWQASSACGRVRGHDLPRRVKS